MKDKNNILRAAEHNIKDKIKPGKVLLLLGARRTGKSFLIKRIMQSLKKDYLFLNCEDSSTADILSLRTEKNYRQLLGKKRMLILDEAQKIPEMGLKLKLMVDTIEDLCIIATGSSAFELGQNVGEPLLGRKWDFRLFPFAEMELWEYEKPINRKENMLNRMVYGNYPELSLMESRADKKQYLDEILQSHLLKDILTFDGIKNSAKIMNLLRLVAFQIGSEVSLAELGKQLAMSKNTVEKYLDLLSQTFILYRVDGFSRNLRKEISKSSRWYFYDNGLRNAVISDLNPIFIPSKSMMIPTRNDIGQLWENYIISERLKVQHYSRMSVNNYFWRTYDQQEIDWVEERDGILHAYEMKWNPNKKAKVPKAWEKTYENSTFTVINPDTCWEWIGMKS